MDNNEQREDLKRRAIHEKLRACIEALGDLGAEEAVPAIVDAMGHPDQWVRIAAIRAAQQLCDPRMLPGLIAAVDDEQSMIREAAVEALETFAGTSGVDRETLFQALVKFLNHVDLRVQKLAATALATLGDRRAARPILAVIGYGIAANADDVC